MAERHTHYQKPSLISQQDHKPHIAYKYWRTLQIDSLFLNVNKSKRRYVKTFPSVRIRTGTSFESSCSFAMLKKQKSFTRIIITNGEKMEHIAKLLRIKAIKNFICPFVDIEKDMVHIFKRSSPIRKNLSHIGLQLKSDRNGKQSLSSVFLNNLTRFKALTSLYFFNFSSPSPFREKNFIDNLRLETLEALHIHFVWMGKSFLINTTKLLHSHPSLKELSVTAVEWKVSENDKEFKDFVNSIGALKKLTSLRLTNLFFNPDSLDQSLLLETISQLSLLTSLTLGMNMLTKNQYPNLENLCKKLLNLKTLYFEFDMLELYPDFFKYLQNLTKLRQFHFKASFQEKLEPSLPQMESFFKLHPQLEKFSFLVFQTPNLNEENLNQLFNYLTYCPKLSYLDLRVRKLDLSSQKIITFDNLSKSLNYLKSLQDLSINLHLWDPVHCTLQSLIESMKNLTRVQNLTLQLPFVKEKCTATALAFFESISYLRQLKTLTIEFCLDQSIDLEIEVFEFLLERLPKLKEFSILYHDLTKVNNGAITPYIYLNKKAVEKYRLSSFILTNVVDY